ncbi:hypothetical protein D5F52_26730 (plasmid) [Brevibacillus laterosporus]|uniref:hypothetical protein n=1 Tax=Brevibacillus laterosporus TaxID=1465 RepID=UPI000E6C3E26|nr:hypothetical protein [Brevibacillus laterosporus]AYB41752.1 hypothetical protein D5F52_26730 [Brevibacillus laterosporus]
MTKKKVYGVGSIAGFRIGKNDEKLAEWLNKQTNVSDVVKQILYGHIDQIDMLEILKRIESKIDEGMFRPNVKLGQINNKQNIENVDEISQTEVSLDTSSQNLLDGFLDF